MNDTPDNSSEANEDAEQQFVVEQLLEAIENQIESGEPEDTRAVLNLLTLIGCPREQAVDLMAQVLAAEIQRMFEQDAPFDSAHYAQSLRALPAQWQAQ